MWAELVVLALLGGFFLRFSGFPPSTKTDILKFQFDQDRGPALKPAKADVTFSLNVVNSVTPDVIYCVNYYYYYENM